MRNFKIAALSSENSAVVHGGNAAGGQIVAKGKSFNSDREAYVSNVNPSAGSKSILR